MPPASRGIEKSRRSLCARAVALLVVPFCFGVSFWASYRPSGPSSGRGLASVEPAGSAWRVPQLVGCGGLTGWLSSKCSRSPTRAGNRRHGPPAGASATSPDLVGLPDAFDWEAYVLYNPQLGIASEAEAQRHYLAEGRAQGRVYRKLRVLLRYTAGTGLINQHYSHIAAFALAAVLGAEVVLPPAMHRSSFQHIFSVRPSAALPLPQ